MAKDSKILEDAKERTRLSEDLLRIQNKLIDGEDEFLNIGEQILKNLKQRYDKSHEDYDLTKKAIKDNSDQIIERNKLLDAGIKARDAEYEVHRQIEDASKQLIKSKQLEIDKTDESIDQLRKSLKLAEKRKDTTNIPLLERKHLRDIQLKERRDAEKQLAADVANREKAMDFYKKVIDYDTGRLNFLKDMSVELEDQLKIDANNIKQQKDIQSVLAKHADFVRQIGIYWEIATSPIQAIYYGLKAILDRFFELDEAAGQFRKDTGFTIDQMSEIRNIAEKTNVQFRAYGVTIKDAYLSAASLYKAFGNANQISQELVDSSALLNKNYGVANDISAGFLVNMKTIGGYTDKQASSAAAYAINLAKASGVPLSDIMKDVAEASEEARAMVGGLPDRLIKASAAARRLGSDLNASAKSARGLLNFEESINAELEASVLAGKNLNFMDARRKAFAGDIAGAQEETLRMIQSIGDFNSLNVLQQEAIAKASGYGVGEIQKMVQAQKNLSKLTSEQRKEWDRLVNTKKEEIELTGDQILREKQLQTTKENFNNAVDSLKESFTTIFAPLFGWLTKIASVLADAAAWVAKLSTSFGKIGEGTTAVIALGAALLGIFATMKLIGAAGGIVGSLMGKATGGFGDIVKTTMEGIASGLKAFSSISPMAILKGALAIALLGASIIPFAFAIKMFADVKWSDVFIGLGALASFAVVGGIMGMFLPVLAAGALAIALIGVALIPFAYAAGLAGEGMVKLGAGFESLVPQLSELSVLAPGLIATAAAITALSVSMAAFGYGQVASGLGSFIGGFLGGDQISKFKALAELGPKLEVTAAAIQKINGSTGLSETKSSSNSSQTGQSSSESSQNVEKKLDELIQLMKSGGISVNLDGKKVSRELAISIS